MRRFFARINRNALTVKMSLLAFCFNLKRGEKTQVLLKLVCPVGFEERKEIINLPKELNHGILSRIGQVQNCFEWN